MSARFAVSTNITNGVSEFVDPTSYAGGPLYRKDGFPVVEVVFWSALHKCWVLLVKAATGRTLPNGAMEITADEADLDFPPF